MSLLGLGYSGIDQSPTFSLVPPPLFLCLLSYVSASGVARIFEQGAKRGSRATERGTVWVGVVPPPPPRPTVGRILKIRVSKWHFFAHKMSLLWVGYV